MSRLRLFVFSVLLAGVSHAATPAPAPGPELDLAGPIQLARDGFLEHALRILDTRLAQSPDHPALLELKTDVEEEYARQWGVRVRGASPRLLQAEVTMPPALPLAAPVVGKNFTVPSAAMAMIWIPAGSFMMSNVRGSDDDTWVTISRGFWFGRTEVTQEQWRLVKGDISDASLFRGSDRPVERLSWLDAMEFASTLTEHERAAGRLPPDYEYTLPTEAQWEYACRAGSTRSFVADIDTVAWYEGNSGRQTHPVAQLRPNAWGLYDMLGNVMEYCLDGGGGYPGGQATDPVQASIGPPSSAVRILRGGRWNYSAGACRPNFRQWSAQSGRGPASGFRLALAPRATVPTRLALASP